VIRRLFWMIIGAVAGVTGYRRISRLARVIQPMRRRGGGPGGRGGGPGGRGGGPGGRSGYRGITVFLGDVRDGMELYLNGRPGSAGHTLEGQQVLAEGSGPVVAARGNPGTDYAKDGR
jgi:hypothetical protein